MSELVVLEAKQFGVQPSKAKQIEGVFTPMVKMLEGFEGQYNEIISQTEITRELCADAKRLRLDIAQVRLRAEKARKAEKEEYLRAGKAIDGVANILKFAVINKEKELEKIEKHFEILEAERIGKLHQSRQELLEQYESDANGVHLGMMQSDVWENYIAGVKLAYENRKAEEARIEAERIAKEKAEAEERERIRLENIRLKKEREEREKQIAIERAEAEKKRKELEAKAEKERLEREKAEAARRAKEEAEKKKREEKEKREREIYEAKLKKEREERERIEAELQQKREAEEKAKKLAEGKAKQARLAPDKQKLETLRQTVRDIQLPEMKSAETKKLLENVKVLLGKIDKYIADQIDVL